MFAKLGVPARPATPPRSPHVEAPAGTAFPFLSVAGALPSTSSSSSSTPRPQQESMARAAVEAPFLPGPTNPYSPALRRNRGIAPTRRDILLVGITFLVAWLVVSPSTNDRPTHTHSSILNAEELDTQLSNAYPEESAGYLRRLGRLGHYVPKLGLGGWLGSAGTTQGHGLGDFGMETICEVGAGGTVRVHGYSDSVAKVSSPPGI
jgi:hypothetical protein